MVMCLGLQADGFVSVCGLGQTSVDGFISDLFLFGSFSLPNTGDLESAVERGEHQAVQEQDPIQDVADLRLVETSSCSPEAHPQGQGQG